MGRSSGTVQEQALGRLRLAYEAPERLLRASYNPRQMSAEARAALKRGIEAFGLVDPLIARGEDRLLLGGHQRLQAAEDLGLAEVPVVYIDGVTDQQAAALNVLLNNPSAQGSWDMARLSSLLSELDAGGFDATLTGFSEADLEGLLTWTPDPEPTELLTDPDEVPDAPRVPITKRGDRITLGRHTLVCGDATDATAWDALLAGRQAGMIWTDPPYGVEYGDKNAMLNSRDGGSRIETAIEGDAVDDEGLVALLRASFALAWANCRAGAGWYVAGPEGPRQMPFCTVLVELEVWRHTVIWMKDGFVLGRADYHYRHEPLWYGWKEGAAHTWNGGRSQDTVLEFPRPRASKLHPTMKPVALIQRCVENSSKPADLIVDMFGGSGSTLIAAEAAGRAAALIELSPAYCDVIVTRWENATGQKAVRP